MPVSLSVPDVSAFSRALERSLKEQHATRPVPPGHVEMLNLLARAAGHRNFQALRASVPASLSPSAAAVPGVAAAQAPPLSPTARKALAQFDSAGRLVRWPAKRSVQRLAMWALWTRFDSRRVYAEAEVNRILNAWHTFGDHATLRRELINDSLMTRRSDCSQYRKAPARPDDEARWMLHAWRRAHAG
jgi:hypothetical protein